MLNDTTTQELDAHGRVTNGAPSRPSEDAPRSRSGLPQASKAKKKAKKKADKNYGFALSDGEYDRLMAHRKALGTGFGLQRTKSRGSPINSSKRSRTAELAEGERAPEPTVMRAVAGSAGDNPFVSRAHTGKGRRLAQIIEIPETETIRSDEITLSTWMEERKLADAIINGDSGTETKSLGYSAADAWFRKNVGKSLSAYQKDNTP